MKIKILSSGKEDLKQGYNFYSEQGEGLGSYFLDSLYSDVDSLLVSAGVHEKHFGYYRALSKRFPFAIYYSLVDETILVSAILDCRMEPAWIREKLKN